MEYEKKLKLCSEKNNKLIKINKKLNDQIVEYKLNSLTEDDNKSNIKTSKDNSENGKTETEINENETDKKANIKLYKKFKK